MPQQLCLVADVLGWQQIMSNVTEESRAKRIEDWLWLAGCAKNYSLRYQVVSDTVFATADPTEAGLTTLVEFAKHTLEQGVFRSLPIRGAISLGSVEWRSDSLWGAGVIEAFQIEQNSEWLGITLARSVEPIVGSLYADRRLVVYPTPFKSGPVRMNANVGWNIQDFAFLAAYTTREFLAEPDEALGWGWLRKIEETSLFRTYCKLIEAGGLGGERYVGNAHPHLIELFIDGTLPEVQEKWRQHLGEIRSAPISPSSPPTSM